MEFEHIAIRKGLKEQFDKLKIHPHETYTDMIIRAINGELYLEVQDILKEKGRAKNGN